MTGPDKMEKQINGVAPARLLNARHRSVHGRKRISLTCMWANLCKTLPSTTHTLTRLPWPLLPFAIGMFILVRSLDRLGYIPIFAKWAARACNTPVRAVFFVGAVTAVGLCPLCGTAGFFLRRSISWWLKEYDTEHRCYHIRSRGT